MRYVYVKWVDSQAWKPELLYPEEIEIEPIYCHTLGWIVKEDDNFLVLATELWETGQVKYLHIIPKALIDEIKEFEIPTTEKWKK